MINLERMRYVAAQSNIITSAKDTLNVDQRRIIYLCLQHTYHQEWPSNGRFKICPKMFSKKFGVTVHEARSKIRIGLQRFYQADVEGLMPGLYFTDKEEVPDDLIDVFIPWISTVRMARKRGDYTIGINSELKRHMEPWASELGATMLQSDDLDRLNNEYSQRLFESLCQFRKSGFFVISHAELIDRWSVPKTYRASRSLLNKHVIEKAVNEILEKCSTVPKLKLTKSRGAKNKTVGYKFDFKPF